MQDKFFALIPNLDKMWSFNFIFWAILFGLFLGLIINMGPAFITLVQTSLDRGFHQALWFAFGVILNDAMVISLCILTSFEVTLKSENQIYLFSIGAGIILLLFGIYTFNRKAQEKQEKEEYLDEKSDQIVNKNIEKKPAWFVYFGKGFVLNILNPFVWIFWFSSVALIAGNMGGKKINTIVFFALVLGVSFTLDILKSWGAAKLKQFFNAERTTIMNKCAGVFLMCFGLYFIVFKGILNLI